MIRVAISPLGVGLVSIRGLRCYTDLFAMRSRLMGLCAGLGILTAFARLE